MGMACCEGLTSLCMVPRSPAGQPRMMWLHGCYLPLPMRKSVVPQTVQVPLEASRPFFNFTCCGFFISRFALHLKQ